MTKKEYNDVPVLYCKKCISLKIISINPAGLNKYPDTTHKEPIDYCGTCGNADIGETHIENFNIKYKKFYGKDHLTGNK